MGNDPEEDLTHEIVRQTHEFLEGSTRDRLLGSEIVDYNGDRWRFVCEGAFAYFWTNVTVRAGTRWATLSAWLVHRAIRADTRREWADRFQ